MVFSNAEFLFFFLPATLLVYYLPFWKGFGFRNLWLLLVSLFFYAWGEPIYVLLMILSIVLNYLFGLWVSRFSKTTKDQVLIKKGKRIIALACVYNLGMLFIFKYLHWLLTSVKLISDDMLRLTLPIGISFYTFQALSYVIDVYRGKGEVQKNILNVGLYIAFFPQLIAGPIVRYNSIAEQLQHRTHSWQKFSEGAWRFVIGLSKKLIIANQVANIVDLAFGMRGSELSVAMAWAGVLAFTIQIYFDFSGYSDMAIGLGKMFGFHFNENFNYPYVAKSVSEYWRRWHISLGEWFRDYLYYPLSMGPAIRLRKRVFKRTDNRKLAAFVSSSVTLFIVWMATGIWHGANWTFVIWGFIQFLFIFWETNRKPMKNRKAASILGFIGTLFFVLMVKAIFKADNLTHAISYYGSMFGLCGNRFIDNTAIYWVGQYRLFLIAGIIFCFPVVPWLNEKIDAVGNRTLSAAKSWFALIAMLFLFWIDMSYAIGGGYNPFIYFNF